MASTSRFVQVSPVIAVDRLVIFALDAEGTTWRFDEGKGIWTALPSDRE
jgi:hypothetical protein